ncbi:MAG: hypothetical protein B2I17_02635 [Thermoplasmatales archaeon B_DKE]|nr:MAG: hypothetical protein B2I17_02635 [Thermoplasmatales archaeon B_DKE]
MLMSQERPFKYVALVLPVILIASMLLMTNASSAISPTPAALPSSSTPLWGFNGAYMNYSNVQANNAPPSNLSTVVPYWFFMGSYVNYSYNERDPSFSISGTYNATIYYLNSTTKNFSIRFVAVEEISGQQTSSYKNNTTIALSGSSTIPSSFSPEYNSSFPAFNSSELYFLDSGFIPPTPGTKLHNNVTFHVLDKTFKSDEVTMNSTDYNFSYYASYNNGLILNMSGNGTGMNFNVQIIHTNVPDPGHPPFTLGMKTSTSYTKYEITQIAQNGNFTVSVTGNTNLFGSSSVSSFNGTFNNPEELPVLNMTALNQLNAGKAPPIFNVTSLTVQRNVTITVAAGTFVTDEVSGSTTEENGSIHVRVYFDAISGVATLFDMNYSNQFSGYDSIMYMSMSLSSSNIPMAPTGYGFLTGSVTPSGATLVVNGIIVPVYDGTYNVSLEPGSYYLSATMSGHQGKIYNATVSAGKGTHVNVALSPISNSVTLSGYVTPLGSSVLVNGYMASVNATGYYTISVAAGKYTVSAYHAGYFPMSKNLSITSSITVNFSLLKEPAKANSSLVSNSTTVNGYNVIISGLKNGNGLVSLNFTATSNGTLTVSMPYNDMKNVTIAEILNSSVYINGVRDKNFSITITSNYTVILTVYNLSGDPTLYWTYSPSAVLPSQLSSPAPFPTSLLEDGVAIAAIIAIVAVIGVVMARRKK